MTDNLYIKSVGNNKTLIGEVQSRFNMGLTIDGTKDSWKVQVLSFSSDTIKAHTIVWHENTDTYWVVSHDDTTRYMHENGEYFYKHDTDLLGAIEILNFRDLTDCGFNQNDYTIDEFIKRLCALSNFEFDNIVINYNGNLPPNQKVDYLKTYSNYTPLSALRDFLDGYNCSIKLRFDETSAIFDIYSKTGNANSEILTEDDFKSVDENKSVDKNSYGGIVVSNSENVISTQTKTYPSVGSKKLSANAYEITGNNALLRLPSNIYKVNYVDIANEKTPITVIEKPFAGAYQTVSGTTFNPTSDKSIENALNFIEGALATRGNLATEFANSVNIEDLKKENVFIRYKYAEDYDPTTGEVINPNDYPQFEYGGAVGLKPMLLMEKTTWDNMKWQDGKLYYERGKDTIHNFVQFNNLITGSIVSKDTIVVFEGEYTNTLGDRYFVAVVIGNFTLDESSTTIPTNGNYHLFLTDISFIVNYIPMSDLKIKYHNNLETRDSQLFNQNGKLTDSNALSKRLLSYAKEISADNLIKNSVYYDFKDIPSVGSVAVLNNTRYVINNVSLDFFMNEETDNQDKGYFIEAQFSLSKEIAVKSLMVNPNRNIRDYGIPQNFNVRRTQVYKDRFYFSTTQISGTNSHYQELDEILNLSTNYVPYIDHSAVMELTYNNAVNGSSKWYYQLETTIYQLKKAICEVVDFKDNNIIGYGNQNVWCGWDITRVFTHQFDAINTPISYVDEKGQVKDINIKFLTNEQLTTIYNEYQNSQTGGDSYDGSLFNYSVFIPSDIYNNANSGRYDFIIEANDYNKDATEVPVFEYMCQLMNSDSVLIGENILDNKEDTFFNMYSCLLLPKNRYNENNAFSDIKIVNRVIAYDLPSGSTAVKMQYDTNAKKVLINFYDSLRRWIAGTDQYGSDIGSTIKDQLDYDIAIFRHRVRATTVLDVEIESENDLMFIIRVDSGLTWNGTQLEIFYGKKERV